MAAAGGCVSSVVQLGESSEPVPTCADTQHGAVVSRRCPGWGRALLEQKSPWGPSGQALTTTQQQIISQVCPLQDLTDVPFLPVKHCY